jgi:superfamily II DNA or RNA helicase
MIKIYTAYDNMVIISQVSRTGERVDNSLDYNYEGKYWKMLNLLHYCYPLALIPSGEMNYKLNINNYHYYRMITDMNIILNKNNDMNNITSIIKTKTKLWDHQLNTVNFILSNIKDGKRGFGDASNVGAGKTLTALATCVELYKNFPYNNKVLILLPSESLIKTWVDEINKHFLGINYIVTKSNGNLEGIYKSDSLNIYITTMGRNRDKKINSKWLFVIIDECLTVQNKEAKQTIAAWEQVICSIRRIIIKCYLF